MDLIILENVYSTLISLFLIYKKFTVVVERWNIKQGVILDN